jgi:hypothetical protein
MPLIPESEGGGRRIILGYTARPCLQKANKQTKAYKEMEKWSRNLE